jgi:hypothetical protein
VLPMIVAAPDDELAFGPDDLRAIASPRRLQALGARRAPGAHARRRPHRPGTAPRLRASRRGVVHHLADVARPSGLVPFRPARRRATSAKLDRTPPHRAGRSPSGAASRPVERLLDRERVGRVPADHPMPPQHPHVAGHAHRLNAAVLALVRIGQPLLTASSNAPARPRRTRADRGRSPPFSSPSSTLAADRHPSRRSAPACCRRARRRASAPRSNRGRP